MGKELKYHTTFINPPDDKPPPKVLSLQPKLITSNDDSNANANANANAKAKAKANAKPTLNFSPSTRLKIV